jgi:hypothetical protein
MPRDEFLIDTLVGYAVEGIAVAGDGAFFHGTRLSRDELSRMQADLVKLPRFPEISTLFDLGERLIFLDAVQRVSQDGRAYAELIGAPSDSKLSKFWNAIGESGVNWDVVLRNGNKWYDRLYQASRIDDVRDRRRAQRTLYGDLQELAPRVTNVQGFAWDFFTKQTPSEVLSPRAADVFVLLLMPALGAAQVAHDRTELAARMDQTACALTIYRAAHGQYPRTLGQLVPDYVAEIPDDVFTDKPTPIRYRREGDAYAMWTAHVNGIDDNGRGPDDDPPGDDWVLRPVPVKSGTVR